MKKNSLVKVKEYDKGRFHYHEYNNGMKTKVLKHNSLKKLQDSLVKTK